MSSGEYYLIGLIVLLLVYLFIEWRKQHPQQQPSIYDLIDVARLFVMAAEQMMPGADGNAKLNWVTANLNRAGLFPHLDPLLVRAAIEAGVHALKQGRVADGAKSGE